MKTTRLQPFPNRKITFTRSEFKKIPRVAGCYVLSTVEDDVLYIGQSDDVNRRFQEHLDNSEKTHPTADGKAFWFHFLEYDVKQIGSLEAAWIHQFETMVGRLPILNKVHASR